MLRELVVLALVVGSFAAGALAFSAGLGPAPGGDAGAGAFPTATPTASDGAGDATATTTGATATTATPVEQAFDVTIERVERCGTTCRDVTVSLTNLQDRAASDVVVHTRVYAGNSTAESDLVWSGEEPVGDLGAGETYTTTKRVQLSYAEAYAVKQADGWVTVRTTIETADRTVTFTERRNVA